MILSTFFLNSENRSKGQYLIQFTQWMPVLPFKDQKSANEVKKTTFRYLSKESDHILQPAFTAYEPKNRWWS